MIGSRDLSRRSDREIFLVDLRTVTSQITFVLYVEIAKFATVTDGTLWVRVLPMKAKKSDLLPKADVPREFNARQETRCAVRFPLSLSAVVNAGQSELTALTRNVSASGVLFTLDRDLKPGQDIRFSLRMPGTELGTLHDVLVHCTGRVVRCSLSHHQYLAASTIDEYQFAEQ